MWINILRALILLKVIGMPVASRLSPEVRRRKRNIGVIGIVLFLLFTILLIAGYLPFIVWIIAVLAVSLIANLLLRRVGRV